MIGKLVAVAIFGLILIAITGVDATKYYQDFIILRDKAQPVADNFIQQVLIDASHYDLKSKIYPLIEQRLVL